MEIVRANTEAIYGGHISGRRLRGVKVNPIFQDNESSRSGDACDTQSDGGVPVGEIQIEMYESLPRNHAQVRHCSSAPVGNQAKNVSSETLLRGRGKDPRDSTESKKEGQQKRPMSVHKKQLSRQKGYDLEFDDPDVIQMAETSLPASGNSSPSLYSSNKDADRSRGARQFLQRYYMSTLSEKTGSYESSVGQLSQTPSEDDGNEMITNDQSRTSGRHSGHNNNQSQIHRQGTIGQTSINSLDLMNNNEMSMPDQMLQHYDQTEAVRMSRLRAEVLRSDSYLEEFSRDPNTLRAEDFILCDTLSLRALFSLSNSSSIESEYKALESKLANRCDCKGLPSLKCKCGRAALQKLFREKRDGAQSFPYKDKLQALDAVQLMKNNVYLGNTESSSQVMKSVSRNKLLALHALGQAEDKCVSFSEDTIFNEDNRVTYVKECVPRSVFHVRVGDGEGGYENLGYDGFLTDDEKKALQMNGHDLGKAIHTHGSLGLSVTDLNAPAYLHAYLMGFQHERKGQNSASPIVETRAGPVSIEEIGGITSDDPAFDAIGEATEEEFEYYRRRRRRKKKSDCSEDGSVEAWTKKNSRCRRIKISVIVISVVVGIATAIGLAVHFGAPALGNTTSSSLDQTQDSPGGFGRILF